MKEKELKYRFWQAFRSGKIENNDDLTLPRPDAGVELRICEEKCFRAFDLIVVSINRLKSSTKGTLVPNGLHTRTGLYFGTALRERCSIDRLQFFPIELKSDEDVLDERLARQVSSALFTFGSSIVVLDRKHALTVKRAGLLNALPSLIIGYLDDDQFHIISKPRAVQCSSIFRFNKKSVAKVLLKSGVDLSADKLARRLDIMQLILQKLAYSQFYGSYEDALDKSELDFLRLLLQSECFSPHRLVKGITEKSYNRRLTDFVDS